jgi:hypothetical protein
MDLNGMVVSGGRQIFRQHTGHFGAGRIILARWWSLRKVDHELGSPALDTAGIRANDGTASSTLHQYRRLAPLSPYGIE